MKLYTKISLILLIPLFTGITGCIKEEQYALEPVIEYSGFATLRDVNGKDSLGAISISYTDGDGNIGLDSLHTDEPYKYNYFIKFNQLIDGKLVEVSPPPPNDSLNFNARIPVLTPNGRNKNITGDIKMTIELYFARQFLQSDTIAFEIYIKDFALNKSNVVESPLIVIKR